MEIVSWQANTEQQVRELKEFFDSGHISQSEYEELVEDLLDMQDITSNLELEENKILAQKAIDALRAIAGLV